MQKIANKFLVTSIGLLIAVGTNYVIQQRGNNIKTPEKTIYIVNQTKAAYNSVVSEIDEKITKVKEEEEKPASVKPKSKKKKKATTVVPVNNDVNYEVPSNLELGQQIAEYAIQFNGNPYVSGGNSLTNGTDCSGFTKLVLEHFGISVARVAGDQARNGVYVPLSQLMPGDLVFYGEHGVVGHAALYIGDNQIIHAMTPQKGIRITSINFGMQLITTRRVVN